MAPEASEGTARPDWYADPTGRHQYRYWDGSVWTANVADSGEASVDPLDAAKPTDPSQGDVAEPGVTLVEFLREFMIRNQDDIKLADIDAMRDIVNSGCERGVVGRCRIQGGSATRRFLQELTEQGYIARTP